MGHAQARTKRGLENPQTGSSPHHQASEISAPPDLSSPFPYQLPSYYSSSNLPKLEANFMKDFECCGQTLPGLRDLIQHYEETHATNKSSSNKLNRSEATEQPAPTTLPVANIASSIRRDIIHLLAVEALSTEALREKLPDVTFNDIEDNLKNVALRLSGGEWHLFYECWRQLDIWAFDYDWYEDRQKAIDNAVATYDAMRLESTAPEWEKLLSPEQRGKGICLSKLAPPKGISEEGAAKTRMSKPSAIDIWLTSGSSSTLTEQNQILKPNSSTDDRDGRGSPTVSGSQLPSPPRPISYAGAQEQRQKHSEVNPSWEGVDFSALLNDFGTDWVGIAQWLQTKTPEMVRSHYAHGVVNGHGEWAMIVERVDSSRYYPPDPFGPFYQSALPSLMGQQLHTIHPASDNDSSQPPKSNKTTTPSANDSASLSSPKQLNDAGGNRATDYGLDSFNFDRPNASGEAKEPLSHQRNAKSGHGLDFTFPNLDKFEELPRVPSSRKHPPTSDFDFSLPDRLTENTKLPAVTNFSTQGQQLGSNATRQSDSSTHTRLWEAIAHPQTNDNGAEIATPASARQSWLLQMLEETRKKRSDCKEELSHISLKRAITNRFYPPGSTVQNYPWSNSTSDMITRDNELRHAVKRLEDDEKTYSIELRELSRGL
ncbi:hypothetical protein DL98DRAFT_520969 [Cadophora sp. DSE1049]|nr:hypothetical protein DL98DRAFT_520969 [Cadophora sp. DSE1049]